MGETLAHDHLERQPISMHQSPMPQATPRNAEDARSAVECGSEAAAIKSLAQRR